MARPYQNFITADSPSTPAPGNICLEVSALRLAAALALLFVSACSEDVSHENLDRWRSTQKGPAKIGSAFNSDEVAPELRAHAAQNLIALDRFAEVRQRFETMPESVRHPIVAALAPRLWEDAKVDGEMTVPSDRQWAAKDALYEVRRFASEATRAEIDRYLVEWLAGGYYEGRATAGRVSGRMVVRAIGPSVAPKLLEAARSTVARPPDAKGSRARVGDELLVALAVSADPDAVGFLLQLVTGEKHDESLPHRAMGALITAFVDPVGLEPADPSALEPHIDALVAVTRSSEADGTMKNDAVSLLAAIGMPKCLPPFVEMITFPHSEKQFVWIGAQQGLRCGGADAVIPVAEALPRDLAYERGILEKYVWDEMTAISARASVASGARTLLASPSWVARITGVEVLGKLAIPAAAADDAKKIRELAGDGTVLKGWWGKPKNDPAVGRKPDPTLGQIASEVAKRLEEVAKEAGSK